MLETFGQQADSLAAFDQFIHEFYDEGERMLLRDGPVQTKSSSL
jgi:hypothetical protein